MQNGHMLKWPILVLFPLLIGASGIEYKVRFIGLEDKEALKTVESTSFLTTLKENYPISINALQFRAESDIPDMIKALHAHSYYEATVQIRLEEWGEKRVVFVIIDPGPAYILKTFEVNIFSGENYLNSFTPKEVGIELNKPAIAIEILNAEENSLALLSVLGYPMATLSDRKMIADYETKTFSVLLKIERGPLLRFGNFSIVGNHHVKERLFKNKITWKENEIYNANLIEQTQKKLLDTGLFSSVVITHGLETEGKEDQQLPMRIEVAETKQRSVNVGASYQTFFGPGLTFRWENRNISKLGRKISLQGDFTAHTHTGTATFFVPDFWKLEQDYVFQAQSLQESIYAYHQQSYNFTSRVERRIDTQYRVSLGLKWERIFVTNSVQNGIFSLLEIPLYFRWSSANHLLNPTRGATFEYKVIPSINFSEENHCYLYNSLNYDLYFPLLGEEFLVFAQQIIFDSILSRHLGAIPVPKRVFGSSDQELRGYRYHTVSPLLGEKPIGGRSAIFYTIEMRFRFSKTIGVVPFLDLGTVHLSSLPHFKEKWFKSIGIGVRYFTFLGPLRFDIAYPLNRRKQIDPVYRVLVSIGQTF